MIRWGFAFPIGFSLMVIAMLGVGAGYFLAVGLGIHGCG